MLRRFAVGTALCLAVLVTAGCSARIATPTATSPAAETGGASAATTSAAVAVRAMTLEEKRSLVASNFPVEVAMPMGDVARAQAQGDTAWDYEIVIDAPASAVIDWYRQSYVGRSWQIVSETSASKGATVLTLMKNAAQTRVIIKPEGESKARAMGVLGVGTPVLQTQ